MARIPMVTRTIQSTTAIVMGINTITNQVKNEEYVLPRTYKNDDEVLALVKETNDHSTFIPVKVVSTTVTEKLYGMTEEEFVKLAKELPARQGVKAVDESEVQA